MGKVIALVDDLFFRARIAETARHLGVEFEAVSDSKALLESAGGAGGAETSLILVDLNARGGALEALGKLRASGNQTPIVAFLSHVQTELAEQARAAGCAEVMPRPEIHAEPGGNPRTGKDRGRDMKLQIRNRGTTRSTTGRSFGMRVLCALMAPGMVLAAITQTAVAQQSQNAPDVSDTVAQLLSVACRQETARFPDYLTQANAALFKQLPPEQQVAFLRRVVQLQDPGHALLTTDASRRTVIRCETPSFTLQIKLGAPRIEQNLAFVPVELTEARKADFGMVLTNGGWKFISLGLLMLDLNQLTKEWTEQDLGAREDDAIAALRKLASAIETYRRAFEKLPESLAQLGPAPKEGISGEAAGLVDAELAAGRATGYAIRYRIVPAGDDGKETRFELAATPTAYGTTGRRSFFIDSSNKLRGADKQGSPATAADPLVEESSSVH